MKEDYVNSEICSNCKGSCCRNLPGAAFPEDFDSSLKTSLIEENLWKSLISGNWAIDWWEGDALKSDSDDHYEWERPRTVYIRPHIKEKQGRGIIFDPSYGGECCFLTNKGCSIFETRPSGCRGLKPSLDRCEVIHSSKRESAIEWISYEKMIEALGKKAELIFKQQEAENLRVDEDVAAKIIYLRRQYRWTQYKEDYLVELAKEGKKLPDVFRNEF